MYTLLLPNKLAKTKYVSVIDVGCPDYYTSFAAYAVGTRIHATLFINLNIIKLQVCNFSDIIKFVNFDLVDKPIAVVSKGVTPTVFYWLKDGISKVINPRNINKLGLKLVLYFIQ